MKHIAVGVVLLFAGTLALASFHPFGNPRIEPGKGLDTLLRDTDIPVEAKKVLVTKCADCHSNETRWPAYGRVAPISWLIERDIVEARAKMNLSHWGELSADEHDVLIAKIIHEATEGDMPPLQYRVLHQEARLTPADLIAFRSMQRAAPGESENGSGTGDAARGRVVFQKRCSGCHAMDADREGPRLAGVFGRKAGSIPGFDYSKGLRNSGLVWNEATLQKWLTDPDTIAPDTKMDFRVPKAQERADLIAFLRH